MFDVFRGRYITKRYPRLECVTFEYFTQPQADANSQRMKVGSTNVEAPSDSNRLCLSLRRDLEYLTENICWHVAGPMRALHTFLFAKMRCDYSN